MVSDVSRNKTKTKFSPSLNPCCNGIWSRTLNKTFLLLLRVWNPWFSLFFTNHSEKVHFLRGCKSTVKWEEIQNCIWDCPNGSTFGQRPEVRLSERKSKISFGIARTGVLSAEGQRYNNCSTFQRDKKLNFFKYSKCKRMEKQTLATWRENPFIYVGFRPIVFVFFFTNDMEKWIFYGL